MGVYFESTEPGLLYYGKKTFVEAKKIIRISNDSISNNLIIIIIINFLKIFHNQYFI